MPLTFTAKEHAHVPEGCNSQILIVRSDVQVQNTEIGAAVKGDTRSRNALTGKISGWLRAPSAYLTRPHTCMLHENANFQTQLVWLHRSQ